MKRLLHLPALFLLALALPAYAQMGPAPATATSSAMAKAPDKPKVPPYFDPATFDYKAVLVPPPANDSAETKGELQTILKDQQDRTQDEIVRITRENKGLNVYLFDTVLGSWFKKENLPATNNLFDRVAATVAPITAAAKDFYNRPRPPLVDPQVKPCIELPKSASYPSGHSTTGNLLALVLAEVAPASQKDAILARGKQIGDDRVLAGVHYPSDVTAGEKLAQAVFAKLQADPGFAMDLAKAKEELLAAEQKNK